MISLNNLPNNTKMSTFESTTTSTTTIPFHNNATHKRRGKTPSFSSILLDAIYRSIDDTYTDTDSSSSHHTHTPKSATTTTTTNIERNQNRDTHDYDYVQASKQRRTKMRSDNTLETIELRHAIMIDSWVEKQPPQQQPQPQPQPRLRQQRYYYNVNNCDHDEIKFIRQKSVPTSNVEASCFTQSSFCTNIAPPPRHALKREVASSRIFNKTKLKALKIYSDLKKSKQQQQPVSPGARIAAFLNSIFRNSTAPPPPRKSPENPASSLMPATTSACSSASSFSRSCLSKSTTTSTEKSKRSVRFCPESTTTVVLDTRDDTRTFSLSHNKSSLCGKEESFPHNDNDDQKLLVSSKPAASDHHPQQSRKWKREKEIDALLMMVKRNRNRSNSNGHDYKEILTLEMDSDDEEMINVEEDDGESCASSDLFELENFSSIGVSRFNQELPVYGTTSLKNLLTS